MAALRRMQNEEEKRKHTMQQYLETAASGQTGDQKQEARSREECEELLNTQPSENAPSPVASAHDEDKRGEEWSEKPNTPAKMSDNDKEEEVGRKDLTQNRAEGQILSLRDIV